MYKYTSTGTLQYKSDGFVSLAIDLDLLRYYKSTIWAYKDKLQVPMHGAHITVVNGFWEFVPPDKKSKFWGKYQGERVKFAYDGEVTVHKTREGNGITWGMRVESPRLEVIRMELGLPRLFAERPFHFTIAKLLPPDEVRKAKKEAQERARAYQKANWARRRKKR